MSTCWTRFLLCCGCTTQETKVLTVQEQEMLDIRKLQIENYKRLRAKGLKTYRGEDAANKFAKKIHESRKPYLMKSINNAVDDFNKVITP